MKRFVNSGMFGVAVVCFLLPFFNIKCNGTKLISVSGIELATGTNVAPPTGGGMFDSAARSGSESAESKKMFEVPLLLALIVLVGGCIATLVMAIKNQPEKKGLTVALYIAIATLALMVAEAVSLFVQLKDLNSLRGGGMGLSWHFDIGFWFVTLIAIGLIVYNIVQLRKPATSPEGMFDDYNPAPPPPGMDV